MSSPERNRPKPRNRACMAAVEWARLESAHIPSWRDGRVLVELAEHVGADGVSRPVLAEVLRRLPGGFGSYRNAVSALLKLGLLETARHGGRHHTAEYRLAVSGVEVVSRHGDATRDADGVSVSRHGDADGVSVSRHGDADGSVSRHGDADGVSVSRHGDADGVSVSRDGDATRDAQNGVPRPHADADAFRISHLSSLRMGALSRNASHTCTREDGPELVDALKAAAARHGFTAAWLPEHSDRAAELAAACRGAGVVDVETVADRAIARTVKRQAPGNSWTYALKAAESVLLELRADHNRPATIDNEMERRK